MKNKIIGLIIILALLSIYPIWRYTNNAKIFAQSVLGHASKLGEWTNGSISSNFDGKITVRNLTFKPNGFSQGFGIESVSISTDPMFLLKSSSSDLGFMLPESLSLSINGAILNSKSNDIIDSLQKNSLWMMMAGYAGSFGCNRETYKSFDDAAWQDLFSKETLFNIDLFYSRQANGSLDADLILDAENLFSTTWSSNLKSSYIDNQILIDELLVDKLYYSYLDNGFNLIRNNTCAKNYQSSFAAYRLSSSEHLQKFLRTHYAKELPQNLLSWYQRSLAPDAEYNATITLDNRKFIGDVYSSIQSNIYENATIEIANTGADYLPVKLKEIDFTNIDTELLKRENLKKIEQDKQAELERVRLKNAKNQPAIYRTGVNKTRKISLNNLSSAVNSKVRLKTMQGRPIIGYLLNINNGFAEIETTYKTGKSTLTIPINRISSVELVK